VTTHLQSFEPDSFSLSEHSWKLMVYSLTGPVVVSELCETDSVYAWQLLARSVPASLSGPDRESNIFLLWNIESKRVSVHRSVQSSFGIFPTADIHRKLFFAVSIAC
jgi:hypothetical protein